MLFTVSKQQLERVLKYGGQDGLLITKSAWERFIQFFRVIYSEDEKNKKRLVIALRNGPEAKDAQNQQLETEVVDKFLSFYDLLSKQQTRVMFKVKILDEDDDDDKITDDSDSNKR